MCYRSRPPFPIPPGAVTVVVVSFFERAVHTPASVASVLNVSVPTPTVQGWWVSAADAAVAILVQTRGGLSFKGSIPGEVVVAVSSSDVFPLHRASLQTP